MKKALNEPNGHEEHIKMAVITLGMNIDVFQKVCQFLFFGKFARSGPAIKLQFLTMRAIHQQSSQSTQRMSEAVEHDVDRSRK